MGGKQVSEGIIDIPVREAGGIRRALLVEPSQKWTVCYNQLVYI